LFGVFAMVGEDKERWQELCERAATEQDPKKLIELVEEIDRLLEAKQNRLNNAPSTQNPMPETQQ
jgi:hypothetical protein